MGATVVVVGTVVVLLMHPAAIAGPGHACPVL